MSLMPSYWTVENIKYVHLFHLLASAKIVAKIVFLLSKFYRLFAMVN